MDLALFTRNRLKQLRLSPRDLARASSMAESYLAGLLEPNGLQAASERTHVHDQLERVLQLPHGHLAKLADLQRRQHLKKRLENPSSPLLHRRLGSDSLPVKSDNACDVQGVSVRHR
jgi:hypothetical protein